MLGFMKRFTGIWLAALFFGFNCQAESEGEVAAASLLKLVKHGEVIKETENKFRAKAELPKNISMFSLTNATFWTADMDIDCDGRITAACNKKTDPDFQNQLSCGEDIAADVTPYFVIPGGAPANAAKRDIKMGQVGAIIYKNRVVYAVFLDTGPKTLIGEASCATAKLLGVNPDPRVGGTDGPVAYIVFAGESGRLKREDYADHAKAIEVGVKRAKELLGSYGVK